MYTRSLHVHVSSTGWNSEIHNFSTSRVNNDRTPQLPAAALFLPNPHTSSISSPVADEHLHYSLNDDPRIAKTRPPQDAPMFFIHGQRLTTNDWWIYTDEFLMPASDQKP